jgi:hypothetical protein
MTITIGTTTVKKAETGVVKVSNGIGGAIRR